MIFLITIISLLLGYYLGTKRSIKSDIKQSIQESARLKTKLLNEDLKPGVLTRPSAQEIYLRNEDPQTIEEKEEMTKAIEQSPELMLAKQRVDDLKKKGLL